MRPGKQEDGNKLVIKLTKRGAVLTKGDQQVNKTSRLEAAQLPPLNSDRRFELIL